MLKLITFKIVKKRKYRRKKKLFIKRFINKIKNLYKFFLFIIWQIIIFISFIYKSNNIKIALCTMGKKENLYVDEFIHYYRKLGFNKIFIYDDNDANTEKFRDVINPLINYVKIYENIKNKINNQLEAFTDCYKNNKDKFDWFLMVDMDEYLVIVNDTLKNYLLNPVFNKCDFIKIHWAIATDNNLLHYDNRSLFERFKGPYKYSRFIKSMIRGHIDNLKYWVHSPYFSPKRNITCNNIGQIIEYKNINFESILPINTKKAYIIHYKYKSTEEFINKYKRGYSNWFKDRYKNWQNLKNKIEDYFRDNENTKEKIDYLQKELKLNLENYKKIIKK